MGSLNPFKKPKMPEVKMPEDTSKADLAKAEEEDLRRRKEQRGRAATLLTSKGSNGDDSYGVGTKALLG